MGRFVFFWVYWYTEGYRARLRKHAHRVLRMVFGVATWPAVAVLCWSPGVLYRWTSVDDGDPACRRQSSFERGCTWSRGPRKRHCRECEWPIRLGVLSARPGP